VNKVNSKTFGGAYFYSTRVVALIPHTVLWIGWSTARGQFVVARYCLTFARCRIISLVTSISANRWNNLRTNIPLSNVSSPRYSHLTFYASHNARAYPSKGFRISSFDLGGESWTSVV